MFFLLAFSEVLNKKMKILKTFYFGTLTCLFSFLPMISSDEEPMDVDGGPSSPPTNTAGGAQVKNLLTIPHIYNSLYLKQRSNENIPHGK